MLGGVVCRTRCDLVLSLDLACTQGSATGIPFRRGYLLHGVPGRYEFHLSVGADVLDHSFSHASSGKTSLIHSLAGECF